MAVYYVFHMTNLQTYILHMYVYILLAYSQNRNEAKCNSNNNVNKLQQHTVRTTMVISQMQMSLPINVNK